MLRYVLVAFFVLSNLPLAVNAKAESLPVIELNISDYTITAEVANTPATRATGLMHRKHLPENSGMLFVFPRAGIHGMWMQNTQLPLSVAFLDESGVIVNIADMVPYTLTPHRPIKAAKYALEMNQGWFRTRGVEAGEQVLGLEQASKVEKSERD